MPTGGIFVMVKRTDSEIQADPAGGPYKSEDISAQIVDHLCYKYGYNRDGARDLVEYYWQDEYDTEFMETVKAEFLASGLLGKEYLKDEHTG